MMRVLRALRREAGMTQKQLSDKLGYTTPQFISNVERGLCMLPKTKFKKAAKILNTDPWIFAQEYLKHERNQLIQILR